MLRRFLTECKKYNLPIWLTEFSCPNGLHGTAQQQEEYMSAALQVITSMPEVHRYGWFAPRTSGDWLGVSASLLQPDKAELSSLGELYMQDAVSTQISSNWTFHSTDLLWSDVCDHCYSDEVELSRLDVKSMCQDCGFSAM